MELHYQSYGAGFPLIILHGLFGSLDNWQPVSRRLGEHFQVFALDLRNHGRSPHSDDFNYQVMAEDMREFMEQHGLSQAHVLGHSMGGKAAMHFALHYPQLVARLIVVDIAPRAYAPVHLPLFDAMLSLDLSSFSERHQIDAALAAAIPETATRQFLLKNIGRDDYGAFRWKLNLLALRRNYPQLNQPIHSAQAFNHPTLFLKGERSDYIHDADIQLIKVIFINAQIITIPGAGHWIHADTPEKLIDTVLKFMR
jgi:esterase